MHCFIFQVCWVGGGGGAALHGLIISIIRCGPIMPTKISPPPSTIHTVYCFPLILCMTSLQCYGSRDNPVPPDLPATLVRYGLSNTLLLPDALGKLLAQCGATSRWMPAHPNCPPRLAHLGLSKVGLPKCLALQLYTLPGLTHLDCLITGFFPSLPLPSLQLRALLYE